MIRTPDKFWLFIHILFEYVCLCVQYLQQRVRDWGGQFNKDSWHRLKGARVFQSFQPELLVKRISFVKHKREVFVNH